MRVNEANEIITPLCFMIANGLSYDWISAHALHTYRLIQTIRSADVEYGCSNYKWGYQSHPTHQPVADTVFAFTISGLTESSGNDSSISSLYRSCIQSFCRLLDALKI